MKKKLSNNAKLKLISLLSAVVLWMYVMAVVDPEETKLFEDIPVSITNLNDLTDKDLVIITNVEKNKFYEQLKVETSFQNDSRIKFVGTVYDQHLLKKIREEAYGYIHGHEVGGTNPSLLEALASTQVNLLLDVSFNKEVAGNAALYWSKEEGSLKSCIDKIEKWTDIECVELGENAKAKIRSDYNWDDIIERYESIWKKEK